MTPPIRRVPKPGAGRAEIEQLAERAGWSRYRTVQASGNTPFEIIWLTRDQGATVHWIEGELTPVHYVVVTGADTEPVLDVLRAGLDLYDDASLAELFDGTRDGVRLMDALNLLGVHCSGPFDPEMFALFRWALHDPEPVVRRVALMSAANTGWEEFTPLMEYLRDHDPVVEVREDAEAILAARSRGEDS
ncbi:hypothetical protein OG607_39335 [Streptomyces sp. NBC_01537]|uniref:HEAT repeat domain-containing protein n=1 Tax=Streptomyces sp. NBC_01537 TaxID=2903896 RepID=UPI003867BDCB